MDIDVSALKALVREKDLSLDLVVETIEQALLVAYLRTEGASQKARVTLDRKTGHVTVWAAETDDDGVILRSQACLVASRRPRNAEQAATVAGIAAAMSRRHP